MQYTVLHDSTALAEYAADLVESEIRTNAGIVLGLAGGSTPRATYESLAKRSIDWSETMTWMTDERWVAPDSPDANQRMVRESLVDATGVEFLAPDTGLASPYKAAVAFSDRIVRPVHTASRAIVLLGIGTDGHTASLFPASPAMRNQGSTYVKNYVDALRATRLTATLGLIANADVAIFLVAGESKAEMVASIASGANVPASRVTAKEKVLWLLDEGAASGL